MKPADVQELTELLPTMRGWLGKGTREIDAFPLLRFREQLKRVGLLRNYKGSFRLSKLGREALANPERLWRHLSEQLVRSDTDYVADASVVILVYAATTDGEIDQPAIARTLTFLGWEHGDGTPLTNSAVYHVWNELWDTLGNLSPARAGSRRDRALNSAARQKSIDCLLVHQFQPKTAGFVAIDGCLARDRGRWRGIGVGGAGSGLVARDRGRWRGIGAGGAGAGPRPPATHYH